MHKAPKNKRMIRWNAGAPNNRMPYQTNLRLVQERKSCLCPGTSPNTYLFHNLKSSLNTLKFNLQAVHITANHACANNPTQDTYNHHGLSTP